MKSKLLIFVVLCCFSLANSQAQYFNYDLSKYKLPDIKKNMLDFNLNASHSKNNNSNQFSGYSDNDQKTNSYNGLIDIRYYNFRNSLKYQGTQQINLNLQPNIFASMTNIDTSKSK